MSKSQFKAMMYVKLSVEGGETYEEETWKSFDC